ncbi:efflux RND transporter permease subunit [Mesorhizobium sp. B3-2-1]|nr:efflux RND transporter permease subunit [Mesorhizobium sp. B3-2-1]
MQSFQRLLLVVAVARLGLIGVVAYAMMGGIIAGTAITLLFLPALYVTWFRIKEPKDQETPPVAENGDPVKAST